MERVKGIEPSSQAWEARILPLNHTRFLSGILTAPAALASPNYSPTPLRGICFPPRFSNSLTRRINRGK